MFIFLFIAGAAVMTALGMMSSSVHRTSVRVHRLLSICVTLHHDLPTGFSSTTSPAPGARGGGPPAASAAAFHDKSFLPVTRARHFTEHFTTGLIAAAICHTFYDTSQGFEHAMLRRGNDYWFGVYTGRPRHSGMVDTIAWFRCCPGIVIT